MKLYEIAQEYRAFADALENGEIPEEAITDTLEAINSEFSDKIDSIACIVKGLRGEAELIKAEIDSLSARKKRKEREAERLIEYIRMALEAVGKQKFETARNRISFRASNAVRITDEAAFIEWARDNCPEAIKVEESALKSVIADLINTTNVPYVAIDKKNNIVIK